MTEERGTNELTAFLAQRGDHLMRSAALLAGGRQAGEDLLQAAVERLLARWRRFEGEPERYLRQIMANLAIDDRRRYGNWQRKARLLKASEQPGPDPIAEVDLRDALVRMLIQLPARQRTVLVLRYWEQLSEAEIAQMLGWPEGTVKSAASRGLKRLHELAENFSDTDGAMI
jgi:RNA polymerase sigma-70 factor (sigma-E family)